VTPGTLPTRSDMYMRKYRLLPVVGPILGIALGVAIAVVGPFTSITQQHVVLLWLVDLLIVVGFAELVRGVFERYLVETKILRAMLIGRDRVEGIWMEKLSEADGSAYQFSITDIEPAGQAITYGGRIYGADGTFAGNFQPLLCHLAGSRLDYTYFGLGANNLARFGVGYVDFWHRHNYVGMFFETEGNKWYSVIGRRLTKEQVAALAHQPTSQTIVELAAECFPSTPAAMPSPLTVATG
jgi:hypothetical protein